MVVLVFLAVAPAVQSQAPPPGFPEATLQFGHRAGGFLGAEGVAFSPDEARIASIGGLDSSVKVWDIASGTLLRTYIRAEAVSYEVPEDHSLAVEFSPDGALIWARSSGRWSVWETDSGKRVDLASQVDTGALITSRAYSPSGRFAAVEVTPSLALFRAGSLARLWPVAKLKPGHPLISLDFSPDDRWFAGLTDSEILLWNVETGALRREPVFYSDPSSALQPLAFSPDGKWLAVAAGTEVRVYDLSSGLLANTFKGVGYEDSIRFTPDSTAVMSPGKESKTIVLFDVPSGRTRDTLTNPRRSVAAMVVQQRKELFTIYKSGDKYRVSRQDLRTGATLPVIDGDFNDSRKLQFNRGRRWEAYCGYSGEHGGEVFLADLEADAKARKLGESVFCEVLAFSNDGRRLAVGDTSGRIHVWDTATQQRVRTLGEVVPLPTTTIVTSPDGRFVVSGGTIFDWGFSLEVLDTSSGLVRNMFSSREVVSALGFSPKDPNLLLIYGNKALQFLDIRTGATEAPFAGGHGIVAKGLAAVSVDGEFAVASYGDEGILVWDVKSRRLLRTLKENLTAIGSVIFSPREDLLATCGSNHVTIWDVKTGVRLHELNVEARRIAFTPDGSTLVVADILKGILTSVDVRTGRVKSTIDAAASLSAEDRGIYNLDRALPRLPCDNETAALAVSPDGGLYIRGQFTGEICIYDAKSGALSKRLTGHTAGVTSLGFVSSGSLLLSGSYDSTLRIWDLSTGDHLASIAASGQRDSEGSIRGNEWLAFTPSGLFDGSPAAWQQLYWRFSQKLDDLDPVEAFFNEFYHPGLLTEILSGGRPTPPHEIANIDRRQPSVEIAIVAPPAEGQRTAQVRITVREAAAHGDAVSGSGARDLRLFLNGVLLRAWRGDLALDSSGSAVVQADVPVTAGQNLFSAYVFNRENVKSRDATFSYTGAASLQRKGTVYILSSGINTYSNSEFNLTYAVADADAFSKEIAQVQPALGRFDRVETIPLRNADAVKTRILDSLIEVGKRAQPEDAVFLYFAGHGVAFHGHFYLIPYDMGYLGNREDLKPEDPRFEEVLRHAVSDVELERALEGVSSGNILLIIDACQSGQVLDAAERRRGPLNTTGLAQLAYEKGMYVLAASQSFQSATESSSLGHGLLTYVLVEEGLKTNAADSPPADGVIEAREWLDHAARRVPELQEKMSSSGQRLLTQPRVIEPQRPRVYYRREVEGSSLVVARAGNR
jgi:WD40 repeat protein